MKPSLTVANCGCVVLDIDIDVLELADLLAVAIEWTAGKP